jgi:hypothetical protein
LLQLPCEAGVIRTISVRRQLSHSRVGKPTLPVSQQKDLIIWNNCFTRAVRVGGGAREGVRGRACEGTGIREEPGWGRAPS